MTQWLRRSFVVGGDGVDHVPDRPSLTRPGLVVFGLGVLVAVQSIPLMALALPWDGPHSLRLATGSGVVAVASSAPVNLAVNVSVAFLGWFVLAGVTHAGARLFGGTGSFRQTLATVAWVAVPWILVYGAILLVATAIATTSSATVAGVLGGHVYAFAPGGPPAYFDGVGALDLRAWLHVGGVAGSALVWHRAVASAHGRALARGAAVVAAAVAVLSLPVCLL